MKNGAKFEIRELWLSYSTTYDMSWTNSLIIRASSRIWHPQNRFSHSFSLIINNGQKTMIKSNVNFCLNSLYMNCILLPNYLQYTDSLQATFSHSCGLHVYLFATKRHLFSRRGANNLIESHSSNENMSQHIFDRNTLFIMDLKWYNITYGFSRSMCDLKR